MPGHIAAACGVCGASIEVRDTRRGRRRFATWSTEHRLTHDGPQAMSIRTMKGN